MSPHVMLTLPVTLLTRPRVTFTRWCLIPSTIDLVNPEDGCSDVAFRKQRSSLAS